MSPFDVTTHFDHTLWVDYSTEGLDVGIKYQESGYNFPWSPIRVSWARWDRLVAWVELQRKEQALSQAEGG